MAYVIIAKMMLTDDVEKCLQPAVKRKDYTLLHKESNFWSEKPGNKYTKTL